MPALEFVLLCYARNTPYSYDAHTPLSILALGTYLEENGVAIEYFDERIDPAGRFDELLERRPLAVGFSVIGGYQIAASARLSRRVRRRAPGTPVVWGGIAPTTLARETAREDFVDYVVLGEGEETLLELARALRRGDGPGPIRGLAFRRGGAVVLNPARPAPDLEALPFPYQGKARELLRRYLKRRSVREAVGYEASRGCPFLCRFCYSPNFHSDTRVKSAGKIADELGRLRALGVSDLDVYDDTLLGGRRRDIEAFASLLEREGMAWIGNLRINMLSPELLARLEASGCKWLYFGIESGDDDVLRAIDKGFTAAQVEAGLRLMRRSRIPAVYSIIAGLPVPDAPDPVARCLDFAERIHRLHPAAEVQVQSYVPLPGSNLYQRALALGFRPPQRLLDWVDHDHFRVSVPWLDDPSLARKLYVSTFLAYRYRRHLSRLPFAPAAYPLHRLSLWRVRRRCFRLYFESVLYRAFLAASRLWTGLRFRLQDLRGGLAVGA